MYGVGSAFGCIFSFSVGDSTGSYIKRVVTGTHGSYLLKKVFEYFGILSIIKVKGGNIYKDIYGRFEGVWFMLLRR